MRKVENNSLWTEGDRRGGELAGVSPGKGEDEEETMVLLTICQRFYKETPG